MGFSPRGNIQVTRLHTLNEQLQAPCVNYRCYCCCLWQCSAQLPWQNHVVTTGIAKPLRLAARNSASTSASVTIAIKESTTPGTCGTGPLYTKLHMRTGLMWPNNFLKTLPMWTALPMVEQLFIGLHLGTVLMWPNSFLKTLPMWTALTMMVQQLFIGLQRGTVGVAKVLIAHSANLNATAVSGRYRGLTPLQVAERYRNQEMVELLRNA